jgi:hypothetical protein
VIVQGAGLEPSCRDIVRRGRSTPKPGKGMDDRVPVVVESIEILGQEMDMEDYRIADSSHFSRPPVVIWSPGGTVRLKALLSMVKRMNSLSCGWIAVVVSSPASGLTPDEITLLSLASRHS